MPHVRPDRKADREGESPVKQVLIAGIGNVLLGDDGVGPYVARLLSSSYSFEPGVEVEDLGTPALDLIDHITGLDALILIDSVDDGLPGGTITLYSKDDIVRHGPPVRMDPHSPALTESLLAAEFVGTAPKEVLLIGISGSRYDAGCQLSAPVQAAVAQVVDHVLIELDRLDLSYEPAQNKQSEIWWDDAPVASLAVS
jgi:hydrogenase maturation protease